MKKFTLFVVAMMCFASFAIGQVNNVANLTKSPMMKPSVKFSKNVDGGTFNPVAAEQAVPLNYMQGLFYDQDYLDAQNPGREVMLYFLSEGLSYSQSGFSGNGYIVIADFIAASVDANYAPAAGTYTVANTSVPQTMLAGYDEGIAYGYPAGTYISGTYIVEVSGGRMSDTILVSTGNVTVSYAQGTTITFDFGTAGLFEFNSASSMQIENCSVYAYESYEQKNVTLNNAAGIQDNEDLFVLTVKDATGYVAQMVCYPVSANGFDGHYTCGTDPMDERDGIFWYSAGYDDYYEMPMPSYVYYLDEATGTMGEIYFITAGSFDLTYDGTNISVSGTLTSKHGSTFTLNYSGVHTDVMQVVENAMNIYTNGLTMYVDGEIEDAYTVFNAGGQMIYSGKSNEVELPIAGVYFVRCNKGIQKVVVK